MNHVRICASILGTFFVAVPCLAQPDGLAQPVGAPAAQTVPSSASTALRSLLDDYVRFSRESDPISASMDGQSAYDELVRDESPEGYAARAKTRRSLLARLDALDASALSEAERLDADLVRYELVSAIEGERFFFEQMPVTALGGPQTWLPQMGEQLPLRDGASLARYAVRLEKIGPMIAQQIDQMRAGLKAGRTPPRVVLRQSAAQARAQASAEILADATRSPFYKPFLNSAQNPEAAARAKAAIEKSIVPAYAALAEFLEKEYVPNCRETIGTAQSVDGAPAYDYALRTQTTTGMTAQEIHALGLAEVARLRAEMLAVIARTDWEGNAREFASPDAKLAAFIEFLRTDPRFYFTKPEDLLNAYRAIAKRVDPELHRLFGRIPETQYGVREMPRFMAPTSPTAYYYPGSSRAGRPGYFVANTYRLDQRPKYAMVALTLHEASPGHHFQTMIQDELEGVHEFRRLSSYTVFVEGWALYAERLGLEMETGSEGGMYADPYDDFGRLGFEIWRANRLVVDTGIHAMGWTRERAIEYMLANTAETPLNVEREVDRYIGWPGQATAYKIGELRIRAIRAKAERALGAKFDLRAFHDHLLGAGALPIEVLERRMERWMERWIESAAR
ncbi:MAG: DUF885 domain-containing protein [Planctomycetota bacterium]|nr:DUF885 domain-containing protein [Planctomycetota bacterium]